MFAVWPGVIAPGTQSDQPVTTPDFYPTFLQAAGLPLRPAQHCDGQSILPAMRGERMEERAIFWHYPHYGNQGGTPGSSVLRGRYKLIEFFEDGRCELYDLEADVGERRDLSGELPEKARELRALLHAWRREVAAKDPDRNPEWTGA